MCLYVVAAEKNHEKQKQNQICQKSRDAVRLRFIHIIFQII